MILDTSKPLVVQDFIVTKFGQILHSSCGTDKQMQIFADRVVCPKCKKEVSVEEYVEIQSVLRAWNVFESILSRHSQFKISQP